MAPAAARCEAAGDWRCRCSGDLNPRTHNFSELEEREMENGENKIKTQSWGINKAAESKDKDTSS